MKIQNVIERLTCGSRLPVRAVMFDFDGTLATVRAGWMPLMLDMMMETLGSLGNPVALRDEAEQYVARLTGSDTVYQMTAFAEHVRSLGGIPESPESYKKEIMGRLEHRRAARLHAVESGSTPPDTLLVPGARALLEALRERRLQIYLASGTAHEDVVREARLLDIAKYFSGIYGSASTSFTKRELLASLVSSGIPGPAILTFGDGRVEIEETKIAGGTAVGVASDEPECLRVDPKKRTWLIEAGADYIVPNFLEPGLLELL